MTRRRRKQKSTSRTPALHKPHAQSHNAPAASPPRLPLSRRRLWLFRITAAALSCLLFLGLLELTLRLCRYGCPPRPIVRYRDKGFDGYVDNVRFSWRFFPSNIAREFEPFTLPLTKNKNTYRIFVCGASAAEGFPDASYSFARILETMLHHRYPQRSFEVINTAMTAINSHVVLPIAKDCARYQPDLFIVYLGNNEVVGPYGAGTVFAGIAEHLNLIRAGIALKTMRTGQLLGNAAAALRSDKDVLRSWGGMQMFLDKQVRLTDNAMQTVYSHYQANLEDIRDTALHAGASVILCTVASNLKDCPPFASLHRPDLTDADLKQWRRLYDEGAVQETVGNYETAIERYTAAARIDDTFADLDFRLATCLWNLGRFAEAKDRYVLAREHDTLRFRADDRINEIIRRTAAAKDRVTLLDFVRILEEHTPNGISGRDHFYEHVHLTFAGNYLIAKSLFEQIEPLLGDAPAAPERLPPPTETDCARYLAFTQWDHCRLTEKVLKDFIQKPPFTNQLYHSARVADLQARIAALQPSLDPDALRQSANAYRQAIQNRPNDWSLHFKLGRLLTEELKDYPAAAAEFAKVQQCTPHFHRGYIAMGQVLAAQENFAPAIDQYIEALRRCPAFHDTRRYLGIACNKLAENLNRQGKVDDAIDVCRRGLAMTPDDAKLHGNLGILLNRKGRRNEAIRELETAVRLQPDAADIRRVLQVIQNSPQ